jgi:hypothetical protein
VGGLVVRQFEEFIPGEWRSWWVRGELKLIANHPDYTRQLESDKSEIPPFDLTQFIQTIIALNCDFISLDFRIRQDGELRIIEIGDGQVSDVGDMPKSDWISRVFE